MHNIQYLEMEGSDPIQYLKSLRKQSFDAPRWSTLQHNLITIWLGHDKFQPFAEQQNKIKTKLLFKLVLHRHRDYAGA